MNDRSAVVIGCGIMGCDIAAIFLAGGWSVQLVGHSPSKWVGAQERIAKSVQQLGSEQESGSLVFHSRIEDISWANVHIVLESVTENMEIKKSIFSTLDRLAPAGVPMGSNSSSMRITDICAGLKTAERMANTHFFQPAHLVPLVEIAKGERTEASTLDALHQVFRSLGRAPVRVNRDVPGFLANRIQHALMREAFAVIDEGLRRPRTSMSLFGLDSDSAMQLPARCCSRSSRASIPSTRRRPSSIRRSATTAPPERR
ncbi:3-hydroxyacyl-CoA dehydrogenase NAD-binding domain-containing protein [Variovorax sp. CF079]|uniref:3-hydroxyacyl-CoA dehydrogenase family protein n=1 Tax=Variovorax sp. CF079 TaxID=1882774 RepID=UPI001BAF0969|nr:3-hydroxyacyl-CoA dehydrogenase NAD-binding domain-containing protein [Variovorax sp. CF079]